MKFQATHGMRKTLIYGVWNQMVRRCTSPTHKSFDHYGARGITVCERWRKFENFFADMGECPAGHSIERRDNDRGYEPSNCYWMLRGKQSQNRTVTIRVEIGSERLCLAEAARRAGVKYGTAWWRIQHGWPVGRALGLSQ